MIDFWLVIAKYAFLGVLYLFLLWAVRSIAIEARYSAALGRGAVPGGPRLRVQREAGPELIMPLVDSVTVGRLEDNDIVVDDSTVSARHARLSRQNGNWIIEDTNSSNGTFLNGRRITEPIRIDDEDCVRVGRTTIKLELKSGR